MKIDSPATLAPAFNSQPVIKTITMEDPGQSDDASLTTLVALHALAAATATPEPASSRYHKAVRNTSQPQDSIFTSEDGGQSEEASAVSQRAAHLLAHFDDDEEVKPAPRSNFRPCSGAPSYCC